LSVFLVITAEVTAVASEYIPPEAAQTTTPTAGSAGKNAGDNYSFAAHDYSDFDPDTMDWV
jgi:hypothetical protein